MIFLLCGTYRALTEVGLPISSIDFLKQNKKQSFIIQFNFSESLKLQLII